MRCSETSEQSSASGLSALNLSGGKGGKMLSWSCLKCHHTNILTFFIQLNFANNCIQAYVKAPGK